MTLTKKLRGHERDKRDCIPLRLYLRNFPPPSDPRVLLSFFHSLLARSEGYRLLVVRGGISGSAADPN